MTDVNSGSMAMSIVMVRLIHDSNPQNEVVVYAALDNMSSASFISAEVLNKLGAPGEPTEITIRTVSDTCRQNTVAVSNLSVSSVFKNDFIRLPKVYKQSSLPLNINEVVSHEMLLKLPHLNCLLSEIPDRNENVPFGLLIGINCPRALQPYDVIPSVDDGPFAVNTQLGWCISGPTQHNNGCSSDVISCFHIRSNEEQVRSTETGLKVTKRRMYENDFKESMSRGLSANMPSHTKSGSSEGVSLSQEDRMFMNMIDHESRFVDGHHKLPLSLQSCDVSLPKNRTHALQRINGLRKRFSCDKELSDTKFAKDIDDTLEFRISLKDEPMIRRVVLSTIGSIYVALSLVALFLRTDDTLLQLGNIEVPRYFKPPDFASLHHLSNASQTGYEHTSCLRVVDMDGRMHGSLVMGESRVSPLELLTMPRRELTAATVSVKVGSMLETGCNNLSSTLDGWQGRSRVHKQPLRCTKIPCVCCGSGSIYSKNTDSKAWRCVSTGLNPADDASRGMNCLNICIEHCWFQGPQFLWEPGNRWPSSILNNIVDRLLGATVRGHHDIA